MTRTPNKRRCLNKHNVKLKNSSIISYFTTLIHLLNFQTTRAIQSKQKSFFPHCSLRTYAELFHLLTRNNNLCIIFCSMTALLKKNNSAHSKNHPFAKQTLILHINYFFLEYSFRPPPAPKFRTRCILASWASIVSIMFMWSGMWT